MKPITVSEFHVGAFLKCLIYDIEAVFLYISVGHRKDKLEALYGWGWIVMGFTVRSSI